MELTKEQNRRIQNLIDKCNKLSDDSLDIYEVMNTYKCYLNATEEQRDYIYEVVAKALNIGEYATEQNIPKVVGYCRVSSKGQMDNNSLEQQKEEILGKYPNAIVKDEVYSGKTTDRPTFNDVMKMLNNGDTLVVTKLDRFCRSVSEGLEAIKELKAKGVNIHILNMGLIENTPMGELIVTNLLAFAQFERSMIIERTQSGKEIAKAKAKEEGRVFKEGRPQKHSNKQLDHALSLLTVNGGDKSYNEVAEITGISKSTLIRENNKRKSKE